jgi:thiosulfate dehydrogenase
MTTRRLPLITVGITVVALVVLVGGTGRPLAPPDALAHKEKHTADTLAAFQEVFMDQVRTGDLLFHGDGETEKRLNVQLSKTGMACAMCHPYASDTHPHEFPKFQEQINEFATLRDMINWCIEKPNEGVKIDPESPAMKALEAYVYWSTRGTALDPGRH